MLRLKTMGSAGEAALNRCRHAERRIDPHDASGGCGGPQDRGSHEARGVLPTSLFESAYFDQDNGAALLRPAGRSGGPRRIIRPRCDAADWRSF